jgi:hypothetical protein
MDSLRHQTLRVIALVSAMFLILSHSSAQVFPRITFTDLYWLQYMVNNNPPPSGTVDYADSGYYYPQMERLGITHTVTVGDATGLGTVSSPIKVFNAYSTVWDNYRRGLENRYEIGGPTTHDPNFDYPPTPFNEVPDGGRIV